MKRILGLLVLTMLGCRPEVIYSEVSMDFFFDKWWEVEDNSFFDPGTCFLLNTNDDTLRVHYPDDAPEKGHIEGEWVVEDDHIFLEDIYGFDISIWLFGQCGDYSVIVSTSVLEQESKLHKCEF